jgi:hypothetical protein
LRTNSTHRAPAARPISAQSQKAGPNNLAGQRGRGGAPPDAHTGENHSIGNPALTRRNPTGNQPVAGGKDDSFANAEKKPDCKQNRHRKRDAGGNQGQQRCEHAPPHDGNPNDPRGAETIRDAACDRLRKRITHDEGAEDRAQLHIGQREFSLQRGSRYRDIISIQIGHGRDHEGASDDDPSGIALWLAH